MDSRCCLNPFYTIHIKKSEYKESPIGICKTSKKGGLELSFSPKLFFFFIFFGEWILVVPPPPRKLFFSSFFFRSFFDYGVILPFYNSIIYYHLCIYV